MYRPLGVPTQSGRPAFHTYRPTPSGECGIGSPTTAIFTANSVNNSGRLSELQYISTNSFGGPVALSKIPWVAVTFGELSRAKSSVSAGILNTIEKVRSRIAKVTCFTVENGPPSRPPRKWQHYRGFDHLGRWGP